MKKTGLIPVKLYQKILSLMPISCVDLIIYNKIGEILLLKRKNFPEKGEWWFPGGRIHFMEKRKDSALRKLHEECGLKGNIQKEVGTYDLILGDSHAITTVFQMIVIEHRRVIIDNQSSDFAWKSSTDWLKIVKNNFVQMILKKYCVNDRS